MALTPPELVTFDRAKEHLLVTHDLDDAKIQRLVYQASAIVLNYIKQYPRDEYDTLPVYDVDASSITLAPWPWMWAVSTQPPYWWPAAKVAYRELPPYVADTWMGSPTAVPYEIEAATLLLIGALYEDREGARNPLSPAVEALLERWRDPAIA